MNTEKKNSKVPILIVLILIVLVMVAGGFYYVFRQNQASTKNADLNEYFRLETDNDIGISANDRISESKGKLIDEVLYLDYETVHTSVNPGIYYEESGQSLIVTTPTEKQVIALSEDGSSDQTRNIDGTLYLTLDFVKTWSDIEVTEYLDQNYISIKSEWSYTAADTVGEGVVRTEPSIKADILEDITAGQTLRVLDVYADGSGMDEKTEEWTKVRTENGLIGYIQDSVLGDIDTREEEHTSPIGEYTTSYEGGKVNMAFHQTTSQAANNALPEVLQNTSGITVIAPTWFFLNNNMGEMTSLASKTYVDTAHAAGIEVWAVMNDFDGGVNSSESTKAALSTEEYRSNIIASVMAGIDESGADGLNVDFERVTQESADSFLQLIRELSVECRNRGIVLSVDNYVPTFTKFMNREEQARVCDFVVTMCYDEHTSTSEEIGSVASLPFVQNGLEATMKEENVPASKMIAAIPFYTRMWTVTGSGSFESTAYGMADALAAAENLGMELSWDTSTSQNHGKIEVGDITYEIWLEDEESISAKMEVISNMDLAGVAEWKLGQENSDVWGVIAGYLE